MPWDAIGAAIEAGAEDHDLIHTAAEGRPDEIIDVSRPDRHRPSGAGPVPVDE
jgi:hypothetical protein